MIKLVIVFVLILLLFLTASSSITEPFSCMSRHYYKDMDDKFVPLMEMCYDFTDEECGEFQEECVVSNIDHERLRRENSEEVNTMLESMIHTCMIPNPDVVMDHKCLRKELRKTIPTTTSGRRTRRRGNKRNPQYDEIMRKCRIKPNTSNEKYILNKDCDLFN